MAKQITRELNLAVAHVEAALALYLKPYFPEAVEIEGVDVLAPLSNPGTVQLKVYLSQKGKKEEVAEAVVITDTPPANDNNKKAKKSK